MSQPRSSSPHEIRVGRVRQLDAKDLDEDFLELLVSQAKYALSRFQPRAMDTFAPEIRAILSGMLTFSTVFQDKPTPGQQVQDLRWADAENLPTSKDIIDSYARSQVRPTQLTQERATVVESSSLDKGHSSPTTSGSEKMWLNRKQRYVYSMGYVALKWAWDRFQRYMEEFNWREDVENIWKQSVVLLTDLINKIIKVAHLLNSLQFLTNGLFPQLLPRLLKMRMMPNSPFPFYPSPAYDIMNRQLLWDSFLDVVSTLQTSVDWFMVRRMFNLVFKRLRQFLLRCMALVGIPSYVPLGGTLQGGSHTSRESTAAIRNALLEHVPTVCVACGRTPASMPLICAPCAHLMCYYCLHSAAVEDPELECPGCGRTVERVIQQ